MTWRSWFRLGKLFSLAAQTRQVGFLSPIQNLLGTTTRAVALRAFFVCEFHRSSLEWPRLWGYYQELLLQQTLHPGITMKRVFLSHNSADKPFTRRLAHRLEKVGIGVWLDEAELKIGDSLLSKLSEAISQVEFVAAVISKNSVKSKWVEKELQLAMMKEVESRTVVVLPIVIDDVEMPSYLADKVYADFRNPHAFETSYSQLLRTLGASVDALPFGQFDTLTNVMTSRMAVWRRQLSVPRRSLSARLQHRVLIFWHEHGLSQADALHMTADLSNQGILANILQHNNPNPPDAVFVARGTDPDVVARVFSCLPYTPSTIFPFSYASTECGAPSDYSISVGLHSGFYETDDPTWSTRPLPEADFRMLSDMNRPADDRHEILSHLAGDA